MVDVARDADVDRALSRAGRALSRAASASRTSPPCSRTPPTARLEELAAAAHALTVRRFGRTVHLFAPLYLSNECVSVCTYCGFSAGNDIARRTLGVDEVVTEARCLVERGFRHLLLVAGEHARIVSKDYLVACVEALAPFVPSLSIEVQVWDTGTYRRLVEAGCDGLVVYQETYDRADLRGDPPEGQEAQLRLAPGRARPGGRGRHAPSRHRRPARPAPGLAVRGARRRRPRPRADAPVVADRGHRRPPPPATGGRRLRAGRPVADRHFVQLVCALRLSLAGRGDLAVDQGAGVAARRPDSPRCHR